MHARRNVWNFRWPGVCNFQWTLRETPGERPLTCGSLRVVITPVPARSQLICVRKRGSHAQQREDILGCAERLCAVDRRVGGARTSPGRGDRRFGNRRVSPIHVASFSYPIGKAPLGRFVLRRGSSRAISSRRTREARRHQIGLKNVSGQKGINVYANGISGRQDSNGRGLEMFDHLFRSPCFRSRQDDVLPALRRRGRSADDIRSEQSFGGYRDRYAERVRSVRRTVPANL